MENALARTSFLDFDDPAVAAFAREAAGGGSQREKAVRLYAKVRDGIRYDPYAFHVAPEALRASSTLRARTGWCVPKAVLLAACCRAEGIPARLGFADVRNHLSTEKLRAQMGTDLFVYHGYVALHVGGEWRKVSPAFNAELCARFGVPPLEFDGRSDALLHAYDGEGRRHMEYVTDHGTWTGVPLERMLTAFKATYSPS